MIPINWKLQIFPYTCTTSFNPKLYEASSGWYNVDVKCSIGSFWLWWVSWLAISSVASSPNIYRTDFALYQPLKSRLMLYLHFVLNSVPNYPNRQTWVLMMLAMCNSQTSYICTCTWPKRFISEWLWMKCIVAITLNCWCCTRKLCAYWLHASRACNQYI